MKIFLLLCIVALCGAQNTNSNDVVESFIRQAASHLMAPPLDSPFVFSVDQFFLNKGKIKMLMKLFEELSSQVDVEFWLGVIEGAIADNPFLASIVAAIEGFIPSLGGLATVVNGQTPDPFVSLQKAFGNRLTNVMAHNDSRYFLPQALKGLAGFDILLVDGGKYAVAKNPNSFLDSHAATIPDFIYNNLMPLLTVFTTIRYEPSNVDKLMKNLVKINFDPLLGPQPTPTDADKLKLESVMALIRSMTNSDTSHPLHLNLYDFELIGKSRLFEFLNMWKQLYLLMSVPQS